MVSWEFDQLVDLENGEARTVLENASANPASGAEMPLFKTAKSAISVVIMLERSVIRTWIIKIWEIATRSVYGMSVPRAIGRFPMSNKPDWNSARSDRWNVES